MDKNSCDTCVAGTTDQLCRDNHRPVDIEDCMLENSKLRQEILELRKALSEHPSTSKQRDTKTTVNPVRKLRSASWFNDEQSPAMSAAYAERYFNYGLTKDELLSGKPIIGIAQTGSDLTPCNRHHLVLAKRVRDGIRSAGGIAFEFPVHPIQESSRRPTAALDRNLAYLGLVELLHGYPFDGVVLLTGCDKTTPACLMAAATMNIPAICMNVGPMLNGRIRGTKEPAGSGTVLWKAEQELAKGTIDANELVDILSAGTPSVGHCNTMGTASSMNALAEALGMALPGSASIPAPYRERAQCAYDTGKTAVEMVNSDRTPSVIMTREAFENAIIVNSAIGGSSNTVVHLIAIARHMGISIDLNDFDQIGYEIPLLLNVLPAGEHWCEDYHKAGGLPAIMAELLHEQGFHAHALTCNGRTVKQNVAGMYSWDRNTILPLRRALKSKAGFLHLTGNLFQSAIMKTSVISQEFQEAFLDNPADPGAFEGPAVVFDGPEDFRQRINKRSTGIDRSTILVMRGTGPLGFPGGAEAVNMHPPGYLLEQGIKSLPCIGDGRQSGTSGSPSILHASPEAAAGGNLGILQNGDVIRVDLRKRRVDVQLSQEEIEGRRRAMLADGGYRTPYSQTPWQKIFRQETGQLDQGMILHSSTACQQVAQRWPVPRHNH